MANHSFLQSLGSDSFQPFRTGTSSAYSPSSSILAILPIVVKDCTSIMDRFRKSLPSALRTLQSRRAIERRPRNLEIVDCDLYSRESSSSGSRPALSELGTGNGWKYANQGLILLDSAVTEAQCSDENSKAFSRQLYVDSLTYILRGLPDELSEVEVSSLRNALPPLLHRAPWEETAIETSQYQEQSSHPSFLHRLLATSIVQLFIFFTFVIPYVKTFLRGAYNYERTHHLSERLFSASVKTVDHVSKKSTSLAGTILSSGNGRIGGILAASCAWWIEGISGGIHDGVGEGMVIMGVRDDAPYQQLKRRYE